MKGERQSRHTVVRPDAARAVVPTRPGSVDAGGWPAGIDFTRHAPLSPRLICAPRGGAGRALARGPEGLRLGWARPGRRDSP